MVLDDHVCVPTEVSISSNKNSIGQQLKSQSQLHPSFGVFFKREKKTTHHGTLCRWRSIGF